MNRPVVIGIYHLFKQLGEKTTFIRARNAQNMMSQAILYFDTAVIFLNANFWGFAANQKLGNMQAGSKLVMIA